MIFPLAENRRAVLRLLGLGGLGALGLGCPQPFSSGSVSLDSKQNAGRLHERLNEVARKTLNVEDDVAAFYHFRSQKLFVCAGEEHFWRRCHPPGSVIKIVTAYALLESGWRDQLYVCTGQHKDDYGTLRNCWLHRGHGPMRLRTALAQSCNAWFLEQVQSLSGVDWLAALQKFIPFTHMDDKSTNGRGFYDIVPLHLSPKELRDVALGISPLHQTSAASLLGLVSLVATKGRHHPFVNHPWEHAPASRSPIQLRSVDPVADGMQEAVRTGTLRGIFPSNDIAAKTGTAPKNASSTSRALVTGYFPAQNPAFSFVVIKNTGQGAADAGPPAHALLRAVRHQGVRL